MAATTDHSGRFNQVESSVNDLNKSVGRLEGEYRHLATKNDVSKSSLRLVFWIVGVGITVLAIQIAAWSNIMSSIAALAMQP